MQEPIYTILSVKKYIQPMVYINEKCDLTNALSFL